MSIEHDNIMNSGNKTPQVAMFDNVKVYDNQNQIRVATDIINFLFTIANRYEDTISEEDGARGALIAGLKFTVQSYYMKGKRQFTQEDKKKIMKDIEKLLDTHLNSLQLQQVLAH